MSPATGGGTIGVDVGGTKTHAVLFDARLQPVAERVSGTQRSPSLAAAIVSMVGELTGEHPEVEPGGVGIGVPGVVDATTGSVRHAVNLGIDDTPVALGRDVAEALGMACAVDNDANVGALGSFALLGTDTDLASLCYLSIGTGLAAGVVVDGRLHRGARGVAGEIGHFPIEPDGPRCPCGLKGCFETVASGSALAETWARIGPAGTDVADPAVHLWQLADEGDPAASEWRVGFCDYLAKAVYLLAITFDIDMVVLGGGVSNLGPRLVDSTQQALRRLHGQSGFARSLGLDERVMLRPGPLTSTTGAAALIAGAELAPRLRR